MYALQVTGLTKQYPRFKLDSVSFNIEKGSITGLIGRNGAGKSTILKGILGLISTTGQIIYFDKDFASAEAEIKQRIGFVSGGFDFYKNKSLFAIAKTVSSFYANWDNSTYVSLLQRFNLDESKKVSELSEGMKVKFSITLALSHGAEMLIMDEPTSGLDPLSREEVCDILLSLNKEKEITVLLSTHITSDLMRVADDVIYIAGGKIELIEKLNVLSEKYHVVRFATEEEAKNFDNIIGLKKVKDGFAALTTQAVGEKATLDDIMIHFEAQRRHSNA